jgi:hypothetical protein
MPTKTVTCTGSSGDKYNLTLTYTENSTNQANNTSNITVSMGVKRNDGYADSAYNLASDACSYSIQVGGVTKASGSKAFDSRDSAVVSLGTWTGDVTHNADGTLTITIGGSFTLSGVSNLTGGSVSQSWTLTDIVRNIIQIWNGSAWVTKLVYVWNGSAWVAGLVYRWNGSSWVLSTS